MTTNQKPPQAPSPYTPIFPKDRQAIAVALQGDPTKPDAPAKIIASGRGALAEQILDLAFAGGLPVREDADLAGLLATLDLDTPIPSEAIIAVAEILAKVYEANEIYKTRTLPLASASVEESTS